MEVTLRGPRAGDEEALAILLGELGYPASAPAIAQRLSNLARERAWIAIVAEAAGKVIGLATCHLFHTIEVDAPAAYLTALVVAESARGHGAGRALVRRMEEWAIDRGAKRLALTSATRRSGAHAFYERLGFEHTGRRYAKPLV